MQLWQSLNVPQAIVVAVVLAAFCAGALPTIAECLTHLIETLLCILLAAVGAAWPAFEKRMSDLLERLRKQRLQVQHMRRRAKRRVREGVAA